MGGVAVISNPKSKANRKNPALVESLAYVLGEAGPLEQPGDLGGLERVVRQLREREIDVVCVNGGDGTLHKALSAIVKVYADGATGEALQRVRLPKLAILKSGTVNTMARNVGVRASARDMLAHVVESWHGRRPLQIEERTAVVVNGESAGFLFGTGVLYRFMKMYYEGGDPSVLKALRLVGQVVGSAVFGGTLAHDLFAADTARVTADGRRWPEEAFPAIAVGGMNDLGLGFELFHAAKGHPGYIHALGIMGPPVSVVKVLHRVYLGKPTASPRIRDEVVRELIIEGEAARGFMMDGDFIEGGDRLRVEAGPRVPFIVLR
jgi:diacylglycerol kinase family enzyme